MPAIKSVISFGLVAIPVFLHTAVQDLDISFNQLHKEDGERIRYKKVCGHCGKEVKTEDIIKGYQYDKDRYVTVTDEEIEKIKTEKEKSIQILHFAHLNQISPVYFDKSYYCLPDKGGEKAFELLRVSLMEEQKIAVGKTVIGAHESLMAIVPREDGLIINTMFFEDEIKDIPKTYEKKELKKQELDMAKMLINSMDAPFMANNYHDEYQEKLKKLLDDKIDGKQIRKPREKSAQGTIVDLMDALTLSVEKASAVKTKRSAPKKLKAS